MPAKTVRRWSPPRLSVSFKSFLASGTSSAATTRQTRRSTLANSSKLICCGQRLGPQRRVAVLRRGARRRRGSASASALAAIMASTFCRSTRCIRCWNRPTGVPSSGCCDCVPAGDRIAQQLAGLLGQLRQHGGQVDGQLPEQVQADGADVLQPLGLLAAAEVPGGVVARRTCWPGRRRPGPAASPGRNRPPRRPRRWPGRRRPPGEQSAVVGILRPPGRSARRTSPCGWPGSPRCPPCRR